MSSVISQNDNLLLLTQSRDYWRDRCLRAENRNSELTEENKTLHTELRNIKENGEELKSQKIECKILEQKLAQLIQEMEDSFKKFENSEKERIYREFNTQQTYLEGIYREFNTQQTYIKGLRKDIQKLHNQYHELYTFLFLWTNRNYVEFIDELNTISISHQINLSEEEILIMGIDKLSLWSENTLKQLQIMLREENALKDVHGRPYPIDFNVPWGRVLICMKDEKYFDQLCPQYRFHCDGDCNNFDCGKFVEKEFNLFREVRNTQVHRDQRTVLKKCNKIDTIKHAIFVINFKISEWCEMKRLPLMKDEYNIEHNNNDNFF